MDDILSGVETASILSRHTTSSLSLLDVPSRFENEYEPLYDVFSTHNKPLPLKVTGVKESNSDAMIQALKALQEKIRNLELERAATANRFKQISDETTKQVEQGDSDVGTPPLVGRHPPLYIDHEFNRRFDSLDTRFTLQAKELDLMRDRLRQAESDREQALLKTRRLEDEHKEILSVQKRREQERYRESLTPEKLDELEREQTELRTSQSITNSKLRDLEGQLLRQQWQKRQAQKSYKTPQPRVLVEVDNIGFERPKKTAVRRKKMTPLSQPKFTHSKPVPGIHYHLNMKDVPFVVGTSTSPSHSVGANYQKVLSLMKYHNPLLCGAAASNIARGTVKKKTGGKESKKTKTPSPGASMEELQGLLKALEEEFGHLAFEHQELARMIQEQQQQRGPNTSSHIAELETELGHIVNRLENKMEQIQVVKRFLRTKKKTKQPEKLGSSRIATPIPRNGEVRVVTTVKSKPAVGMSHRGTSHGFDSTSSGSNIDMNDDAVSKTSSQESLQVLRKMKKLQNTLQRDDLSWN